MPYLKKFTKNPVCAYFVLILLCFESRTVTSSDISAHPDDYVKANNSNEYSCYSSILGCSPVSPAKLSASFLSKSRVELKWKDCSGNEKGFRVERSCPSPVLFRKIADLPENTTAFIDTELVAGKNYLYRICAYNQYGSKYSNIVKIAGKNIVPAVPSNLIAWSTDESRIVIVWTDNSENEKNFCLERAIKPDMRFKKITGLPSNCTTYTDTGLLPNKKYLYRLRACNKCGCSRYSNIASAITKKLKVNAPENLIVQSLPGRQIQLNWDDKAANETGFKIERSQHGTDSFRIIANVPANATGYMDTGLIAGIEYFYRLAAIKCKNQSNYSNISSAIALNGLLEIPHSPENLNANVFSSSEIEISWTDKSDNEDGFRIERSFSVNSDFVMISEVPNNITRWQDSGLTANTGYYYRVAAWNSAGISDFTPAVYAVTLSIDSLPPSRPQGLTLSEKTDSTVTLIWNPSTDNVEMDGYEVLIDNVINGFASSNTFICKNLEEGTAYTFRVMAKDKAGNRSAASNALLATPRTSVLEVNPHRVRTHFRAMVLNYDPMLVNGGNRVKVSEYYHYNDVDTLIYQYIHLMQNASNGQCTWAVESRFNLDEYPLPADKSKQIFTPENYLSLRGSGYDYWNNPVRGVDYRAIVNDPRFKIVEKVNSGQLDAIWVFSPAGSGFYETVMVGPSPFWINGSPIVENAMNRNIVVYGFGKESHQGVGFMCENTCHMAENIMARISGSWPKGYETATFTSLFLGTFDRVIRSIYLNDWQKFILSDASSWDPLNVAPHNSQAGLSHFPPTAVYNYNWSTVSFDFENAGVFKAFDGNWTSKNGEYHGSAGAGYKAVAIDGPTLNSQPMSFSDAVVEFQMRISSVSISSHAGFLFRILTCKPGENQLKGYYAGMSVGDKKLILARLDNSYTTLHDVSYNFKEDTWYSFRIEMIGPLISIYINDSSIPVLSFSDETYVSGGFGFSTYNTEAFFDNLSIITCVRNFAENWYKYPHGDNPSTVLTPLDWNGDMPGAMDRWYAWWWEHLPKNGGGHYAYDLENGRKGVILNTWWPYIFSHNEFSVSLPFEDIVFDPEDIIPPTAPVNLTAAASSQSSVGISWTDAAADSDITRYEVYRDGQLIRQTVKPYIIDSRLNPATTYDYCVRARDGSGNLSSYSDSITVITLDKTDTGQIVNGYFEIDPFLTNWQNDAYISAEAQYKWEPEGVGRGGGRCVSVHNTASNDARWVQTVTGLTPGETYRVTGWIKGENVELSSNAGVGANICIMGGFQSSSTLLKGTFNWTQVQFSFEAPVSGSVVIGCRLGFYGSLVTGTAFFDDIYIEKE